ncbi:MAG: MerR family copper efflux transcriptional regulator [Myxococcota bacterium]
MNPTPQILKQRLLRVGELAKHTGKTGRALRYYEEMDLLKPTQRSKGGFRLYHTDAVTRIHWIDRLQELGFSLHEIRAFLDSFRGEEHGPAAMDQLRAFYEEKHAETLAALARLESLKVELEDSIAYLYSCQTCSPSTPRTACHTCSEPHASADDVPPLVAAVAAPI